MQLVICLENTAGVIYLLILIFVTGSHLGHQASLKFVILLTSCLGTGIKGMYHHS